MTNPFSGIINSEFKQIFKNAIDALLESTALTLPCRLVFPGKTSPCPNCKFNPATGKSANVYLTGGPIPFTKGLCPVCKGEGVKYSEATSDGLYFAVLYDHKRWIAMPFTPTSPETSVQTICAVSYLTDIKNAKEIIINTDLESKVIQRYVREGEPQPYGLGEDSYIATIWKRA